MIVLAYDEKKSSSKYLNYICFAFTLALEIHSTVIYFKIFTTDSLEELQWMLI